MAANREGQIIPMSLTDPRGADRKPVGAELARRENQLRSLIDCSCDLMTVIDSKGVALFSSRATEKILGYPLEEVVGRNAFEVIHRDDAGPTRAALEASAGDPSQPVFVEHRLRRRDGSWRLMQSIGRGICGMGKRQPWR